MAPAFTRHICVDYSGVQTPKASLKGLRVYCANSGFCCRRGAGFRAC